MKGNAIGAYIEAMPMRIIWAMQSINTGNKIRLATLLLECGSITYAQRYLELLVGGPYQ